MSLAGRALLRGSSRRLSAFRFRSSSRASRNPPVQPVQLRVLSAPRAAHRHARVSLTAATAQTLFSLQNTSGAPITYSFTVSDSTMFSPAWSTNGTFDSSVYVGSSADLGQNFENASFRVSLQGGGANTTSFEHLVSGLDDRIYLTRYDIRGGGALFRGVSGEASGDVVSDRQFVPGADVGIELVDPETAAVWGKAAWTGSGRPASSRPTRR